MSEESTVTYRFEFQQAYKKKGIKHLLKQEIIDGTKGLFFKLTTKKGDDFYRIEAKEDSDNKDKYIVKEKKGETETQKDITLTELKKLVNGDNLEFIKKYITKERGTYKGRRNSIIDNELILDNIIGGKKTSKKNSKKASKKRSKKNSKK